MDTAGVTALKQIVSTLPLVACLAGIMVWGGTEAGEAEWVGTPSMAVERQLTGQHDDEARAMVVAQVEALGCSTTPALTDRVAVRNAHGADTGVVRVITFDQGWTLSKAGAVYVEGFCS